MWRMAVISNVSICHVLRWFILVLTIQLICFVLGLVLPIVVSIVMDNAGLSLTFFSTPMLMIGLYVCPSLIGLSLPITVYYSIQCNVSISCVKRLSHSLRNFSFAGKDFRRLSSAARTACPGGHIGRSDHLPHVIRLAFHVRLDDTPSFLCRISGVELVDHSARSGLCLDWSAEGQPDHSLPLQQLRLLSIHCRARPYDWTLWQCI